MITKEERIELLRNDELKNYVNSLQLSNVDKNLLIDFVKYQKAYILSSMELKLKEATKQPEKD